MPAQLDRPAAPDDTGRRSLRDFTEGSIAGHLIAFSIPMFVGNLLQAMYTTVNAIWVGRFLGPDALAAVSVSAPIIFALIALVMGLTIATTVLVSQYFGARQPEKVVRTVNNSLLLLTVLGLLTTILGIAFRRAILVAINTPPEVLEEAVSYLAVYLVGLVPMFLYNAAGAVLRGLGDSRTPLRFLVYATVMNIVLDPLLIFGLGPFPRLGVPGAALATVISQAFSAVIAVLYLYRSSGVVHYRPGTFRVDWELTRLTFKIGLPAGVQQVLVSLSALVVSSVVNRFGYEVVAGFGAGQRFDQFAFLPAMSVGLAVSAVVGQNLGAGEIKRVHETVKWSVLLAGGITLVVSLVALIWPRALMVPFTQDPVVIAEGAAYLRYMAFGYVPLALMFAMTGVLRGAGDTVPAMLFTLVSLWVVRVPLAHYLSLIPSLGAHGAFAAIAVSPYVGMVAAFLYYRSGRWQTKAVARRRDRPASAAASAAASEAEAASGPV